MDFRLVAHRGESFDAPENTLASVNLAWNRNADAVEIDVHLSKDKHVVVIHDPNTKRTGGRNKKVINQTLEELKELDVGSWKQKKYKNERIPTLKEVLETVPQEKTLIIEIKSDKKILPYIKEDILNSYVGLRQIEIISFDYSTVIAAKMMLPEVRVLYLANLDYSWITRISSPSAEKLINRVNEGKLDGLNVWAGKMLTQSFVKKVNEANLLLYVWTVNNPIFAKTLFSWGVDAVTTDRAYWMKEKIFL